MRTITSALRLHTRLSPTSDIAQVAAFFSTRAPNLGIFNGMLFKDMVAKGISFQYSFFKANVTGGNNAAAPMIKMEVFSPSTGNWTTFVWEPYQQGTMNPTYNIWVSNDILNTTGTSVAPNSSGCG